MSNAGTFECANFALRVVNVFSSVGFCGYVFVLLGRAGDGIFCIGAEGNGAIPIQNLKVVGKPQDAHPLIPVSGVSLNTT